MKMYDYLVYYTFSAEGYLTASTGTMQVSRKKKIKTFEDVNQLQSFIQNNIAGASNLAINNFILLGRNKH
jgi:hypothetical protein